MVAPKRRICAIMAGMHECERCGTLHPGHDDPPMSQAELMDACDGLRQERENLELLQAEVVGALREYRVPWVVIAERLGVPDSTLRRTYAAAAAGASGAPLPAHGSPAGAS